MGKRGQLTALLDGDIRWIKYLVSGETIFLEESGRVYDPFVRAVGWFTRQSKEKGSMCSISACSAKWMAGQLTGSAVSYHKENTFLHPRTRAIARFAPVLEQECIEHISSRSMTLWPWVANLLPKLPQIFHTLEKFQRIGLPPKWRPTVPLLFC